MIQQDNGQHDEVNGDANGELIETPPEQAAAPCCGIMSRAVYSTCYALSFGVAWPTFMVLRALPEDGAIRTGLRDGMQAAADSSDRTRERISHTAGAARRTAEDAYANVAQKVQERVEAVQDSIAERRYRRRLGDATA